MIFWLKYCIFGKSEYTKTKNKLNKPASHIIEGYKNLLKDVKKMAIFTHLNPDGDAIGSALAFQMAMKQINIESEIFIANEVPQTLSWMAGSENIKTNLPQKTVQSYVDTADLITCLDFNEPSRIDYLAPILAQTHKQVLVLDHHPQVQQYNGLQITDTESSSTSELIYWILKASHNIVPTKAFAECLYTGIVTDTGSFAYNSSSPSTFKAVAELLETGFDKDKVTNLVFQQFEPGRMQLLGHMLANRLKILKAQQTAYTYLTLQDLEEFNFKPGDTEGFVNYPLSIKDILFTAFFIEKPDHIKISFRSKGTFPANEFSKHFFHGGGHLNAAGGQSYEPLQATLKKFEKLVKTKINEL